MTSLSGSCELSVCEHVCSLQSYYRQLPDNGGKCLNQQEKVAPKHWQNIYYMSSDGSIYQIKLFLIYWFPAFVCFIFVKWIYLDFGPICWTESGKNFTIKLLLVTLFFNWHWNIISELRFNKKLKEAARDFLASVQCMLVQIPTSVNVKNVVWVQSLQVEFNWIKFNKNKRIYTNLTKQRLWL